MSGTKFFENFEFVQYSFGNREDPVLFNNITQYVDIIDKIKQEVSFLNKYPNRTIVTADDIGALFPVGQVVEGTTSGTTGTIIKRNLDLGQLIIKTTNETKFTGGEQLRYTDLNGVIQILTTTSETEQYNSIHHYENTSGVQVDVDPHNLNTSGLVPITFRERMEAKNDSLKQIITIRPDSIDTVVSEFNRMLKR